MFAHLYKSHDGVVNGNEFHRWVTSDKHTECFYRGPAGIAGWSESLYKYTGPGDSGETDIASFLFAESSDVKDGSPIQLHVNASNQILLAQILERIENRWPSLIL